MRDDRVQKVCLVILAVAAVTAGLVFLKTVLIPLVFAVFVYSAISPIIDRIEDRLGVKRWASIAISVLVLALLGALVVVMGTFSVAGFVKGAALYKERTAEFIGWSASMLHRFGIEVSGHEVLKEIPIMDITRVLTGGTASFIGNAALVGIFVLFMVFGRRAGQDTHPALATIEQEMSTYAWVKLLTSALTGIAAGLVLWVFGVELVFMFAALTLILNFIPNLGSVVATLLPIPVMLLQFGVSWEVPVVLGLLVGVQFLVGNLIEPKLMGQSLDLHPTTILLAVVFWGVIWGMPGMLLSVPLTSAARSILAKGEGTKPLAEILSGRLPGGKASAG